jgi:hypothetical protein
MVQQILIEAGPVTGGDHDEENFAYVRGVGIASDARAGERTDAPINAWNG